MKRFLTSLLLIGLRLSSVHAQLDPADQKAVSEAAFQLTKATVEFVATDAKTYGYRKLTFCATCRNYDDLIKFTVDNKLTKADELVRDAQKQLATLATPAATSSQMLTGLQQYLHNRVTGGDKSARLTLPSYKNYAAQTAKILAGAGVEPGAPLAEPATPATEEQLAAADTLDTEPPVSPGASVTKADSGLFSYGGLALLLSMIDLAGLILLWRQRGQKTAHLSPSTAPVAEVSDRVTTLERERATLLSRISKLEKTIQAIAERPAPTAENRRNEPAPSPPAPASAQPVSQATQPVQPVVAPLPPPVAKAPQPGFQGQPVPGNQPRRRDVILYGRTADLGDGFSGGSLLTTPDRDTVFQIEIRTDSQAVYRITEEPGAQQLALSDPYSYLADACEYLAKPIPNARIRTDQPGQLALQGDKWKIIEKAKISFY